MVCFIYLCYIKVYVKYIEIIFIRKYVTDTYHNARAVEKAVSDMSASDDSVIRQTQTNNTLTKRRIKKPKIFGDTSSNEGIYRTHF